MSYDSTFLYDGYLGNLTVLADLQQRCRFTQEQAAQACFVSVETYRRWLRDRRPNPTAVKLMAILAGYVPWHGWEDWEMHNGYLFPPGYTKNGISPGDWFAVVFQRQMVTELKRQNQALENRLRELTRERPKAPVLRLR